MRTTQLFLGLTLAALTPASLFAQASIDVFVSASGPTTIADALFEAEVQLASMPPGPIGAIRIYLPTIPPSGQAAYDPIAIQNFLPETAYAGWSVQSLEIFNDSPIPGPPTPRSVISSSTAGNVVVDLDGTIVGLVRLGQLAMVRTDTSGVSSGTGGVNLVTGGLEMSSCIVRDAVSSGVYQAGGTSLVMDFCQVLNCIGNEGGGLNSIGYNLQTFETSDLLITDSVFLDNRADQGNGGGIRLVGSDGDEAEFPPANAVIRRTLIRDNEAFSRGGGLYIGKSQILDSEFNRFQGNLAGEGGGIFLGVLSNLTSKDDYIYQNRADTSDPSVSAGNGQGGGVAFFTAEPHTFTDAIFTENHADSVGGGLAGRCGAVPLFDSATGVANPADVTLRNSLMFKNTADGGGGGIHLNKATMRVISTTIASNNDGGPGNGRNVVIADTIDCEADPQFPFFEIPFAEMEVIDSIIYSPFSGALSFTQNFFVNQGAPNGTLGAYFRTSNVQSGGSGSLDLGSPAFVTSLDPVAGALVLDGDNDEASRLLLTAPDFYLLQGASGSVDAAGTSATNWAETTSQKLLPDVFTRDQGYHYESFAESYATTDPVLVRYTDTIIPGKEAQFVLFHGTSTPSATDWFFGGAITGVSETTLDYDIGNGVILPDFLLPPTGGSTAPNVTAIQRWNAAFASARYQQIGMTPAGALGRVGTVPAAQPSVFSDRAVTALGITAPLVVPPGSGLFDVRQIGIDLLVTPTLLLPLVASNPEVMIY